MEKSERETVITANYADIADGFIRVWTTEAHIARRLIEKAGAEALSKHSVTGRVTGYDLRVPYQRVGRGILAIRRIGIKRPFGAKTAHADVNKNITTPED